jgi:phosphohistidine phosphatase
MSPERCAKPFSMAKSLPGNAARQPKRGRVSRLFLLRHAKAGWAAPGVRDFDRSLDPSGVADAKAMGAVIQDNGYIPDLTLCSNARRCRETLENVACQADTGRVLFLDKLYTEDAAGYLSIIHDHGKMGSLLIIGHNPMTEDLAMALAGGGDEAAKEMLSYGFPTSGFAAIRFDGGLGAAAPGAGYLEAFLTPANS